MRVPRFSSNGGGGGRPLAGDRVTLSREGAEWLGKMRTWAVMLVSRLWLDPQDVEDVVQEALTVAAIHWGTFEPAAAEAERPESLEGAVRPEVPARPHVAVHPQVAAHPQAPEVPHAIERRRWLARILFNAAARARRRAARRRGQEVSVDAGGERAGGAVAAWEVMAARELLEAMEKATSAARWRVWAAYEMDGVTVEEIARREGCAVPTVYNRIQRARKELARAMLRAGG